MPFATVKEYNNYLINTKIKLPIKVYLKNVRALFYSRVDSSFMDYYLSIYGKNNQFVVNHEKLSDFGIYSKDTPSAKIFKSFLKYNFKPDIDYSLHVGEDEITSRGIRFNKKTYMLTPEAFKVLLVRAKNTKKYYRYYELIDEMRYGYMHYATDFLKNINQDYDNILVKLSKKVNEQKKVIDEQVDMINMQSDIIRTLNEAVEKN